VNDAVRCGDAVAQAVEVVEGTAMNLGAGSRQCCCGRVRAGEADDLMPCVEEFADPMNPVAPVTNTRIVRSFSMAIRSLCLCCW
jgi:hypothetical protein